ncbi:exodeoxyribonuclease III (xth) [Luteitalea pratensis]|uniref:Exodeoxyribonuclease III (Xth) n=1 Tax=Luteitalea pratensis TaxID=1855912 RepID=A0A143PP14_LUTPR|nr:endonuclease/exonuclease/phosphatase family protein [Luteitalea pratensis]AMY10352.1 exodeoxyribonuclease III (xth) [Luteitalea pratensis]
MSHTVSPQSLHEGPSRRTVVLGALAAAAAAAAPLRAQSAAPPPAGTLKVMTFNIRYGTASDGENHWDKRKDFLVDVIRAEAPQVLGVQEALYGQLAYILEALPDYSMVGVGRDDGIRKGEYSAILYRRGSLSLSRSDTFWFSETPERVASTSWGNTITRICTWAQFTAPDGRPLYVYNLHLDHQSQPSREKSVALLRKRVEARDPKAPVIVTGDFNAGEKNPAVMAMLDGSVLRDTFRVAHPDASPAGTFTGFKFGQVQGEKIDYIFVTPEWDVVDAAIVRAARGDRYPSDHFPVTATLRSKGM